MKLAARMLTWCIGLLPRRRLVRSCWTGIGFCGLFFFFGVNVFTEPDLCDLSCGVYNAVRRLHPQSKLFIDHIIQDVIEPQRDSVPNPLTVEEIHQNLRIDSSVFTVNQFLLGYIGDIVNGTFLEVGAGDGEFLSFTSGLEVELNWRGLLVEPREEAYGRLRQRRRAASANACVTGTDYHRKEMLWVPRVDESLSALLQRSTQSKAALSSYVDANDRADGEERLVQCYTLGSIVTAYQRSINETDNPIDLLVLDTNSGELLMMEHLTEQRYRYVLIPIRNTHEYEYAMLNARNLGLNITSKETLQFGYALFQHTAIPSTVIAMAATQ